MRRLSQEILAYMDKLPTGTQISPKDMYHLGYKQQLDQPLKDLLKSGELVRIDRGIYARPSPSRTGVRACPETERPIDVLALRPGTIIAVGGVLSSPTPTQLVQLREKMGLTQARAAALICCTGKRWHRWESPDPQFGPMEPGYFLLFLIRIGEVRVRYEPDGTKAIFYRTDAAETNIKAA